jgi:methylated-DNA-[protein]-cysteine S-methyltransferase/AraC family transcriptional regulator of adaptative response/methylated-DNA-[protein]-cysteine methyltransferase
MWSAGGKRMEKRMGITDPRGDRISYGIAETVLGHVLVALSAKGVCAILIGDNREGLEADLARRFPGSAVREDQGSVQEELRKVTRFVDGDESSLDLAFDPRGTEFQRKVWDRLRDIPAGTTMTYGQLAERIGKPRAVRAVASACAANPIAIAIPCHRVVRSNGDLAGYAWGIDRKRALLEREAQA